MASPEFVIAYASGATAAFASSNPARWVVALGAGTVTLTNKGDAANDGSTSSAVIPLTTNQMMVGEWTALVSTTCSNALIGSTWPPPPSFGVAGILPLPLGSGSNYVSGVLPAGNVQAFTTDASTHTSAFNCTVGSQHMINPSGATFAYTLPAISVTNDGQRIAVVNVSGGTTATVAAPTGSDAVANTTGSTGATAVGPTGGNVKTYVANNTLKQWLIGL